MSNDTLAKRLAEFCNDEMTFPGNPPLALAELIAALESELARWRKVQDEEPGGVLE